MPPPLLPLLRVLDDLAYIVECAALDIMGEGKSELSRLCDHLENDASHAIEGRQEIAVELRQALAH